MRTSRARSPESGFALLLIFVLAAGIGIAMMTQLPRVCFETQRDREEMLIERGSQYQRAIGLFFKKYGRYPAKIEDLESTNNIRFLRRRYIDPMTGKDEWRLIHAGPGGMLTDSLVQKGPGTVGPDGKPIQPGTPGADGMNSASGMNATPGNTAAGTDPNAPPEVNAAIKARPSDRLSGTPQGLPPGYDPNNPAGAQNFGAYTYPPAGSPTTPQQYQQQYPQQYPQPGQPGYQQTGQTGTNQPVQIDPQTGQPVVTQPNQTGQIGYPQNGQPGFSQTGQPIQTMPGTMPNGTVNVQTGLPQQYNPQQYNPQYPQAQFAPVTGPGGPVAGAPNGAAAQMINQLLTQPRQIPQGGFSGAPPQTFGQPQQTGFGQTQSGFGQTQSGFGQPPGGFGQNTSGLGQTPNGLGGQTTSGLSGGTNGLGGQAIGAGIAGVATKFKGPSIKIYAEKQKYQEWEFVFDPRKEALKQQQLAGGQGGVANPGNNGLGQSGFGQPGSQSGNNPSMFNQSGNQSSFGQSGNQSGFGQGSSQQVPTRP